MIKVKLLARTLLVVAVLFSLSASLVSAQIIPAEDFCQGNFDFDKDVDGGDASLFKQSFGRSSFNDPCPKAGRAMVQATGQTVSIAPFDDAWYHAGIVDPDIPDNSIDRFTNNGDGTVTDNRSGLTWLEYAQCGGQMTWENAMQYANTISNGSDCGTQGTWSLTDGSQPGDWRLPNAFEMESLRNMAYYDPCISNAKGDGQWTYGDPFIGDPSNVYWTSTYDASAPSLRAWQIDMKLGASSPVSTPTLPLPPPRIWLVKGGIVDPGIGPD